MISWETVEGLYRQTYANILLVGLVIEEIEEAIETLTELRDRSGLIPADEEILRHLYLKRFLMLKKLRDRFRTRDLHEDGSDSEISESLHATRLILRRDESTSEEP
jgi:hypothetical protein